MYETELRHHLRSKKFDASFNQPLLEVLLKLVRVDLVPFEEDRYKNLFSEDESKLLSNPEILNKMENKEIVARWMDYLCSIQMNPQYIRQVALNYLDIFKTRKKYDYLVRSLQIVKSKKGLFIDDIEGIFTFSKNVVIDCNHPYWQNKMLKELYSFFDDGRCKDFQSEIEKQLLQFVKKGDFQNSGFSISCLHTIKILNKNQFHVKIAENYEAEADYFVVRKAPNVYYPNIASIYVSALREVKSIPNCKDLKTRLEEKIAREQLEYSTFLIKHGIKTSPSTNIEEIQRVVYEAGINDFDTAYQLLISLPIIQQETVLSGAKSMESSSSIISKMYAATVKISNKGAETGFAKGEAVNINHVRSWYREKTLAIIQVLKQIMDLEKMLEKNFVYGLVEFSRSKFIPEGREIMYAQGLYEGFNNNYIAAAHLLVPQIENSLKHIGELKGINMTLYEKKVQHDNTFGGCLDKIEILSPNLVMELRNFFTDNSAVNFRNDLLHGLIEPMLIEHYGKYVWWLTLKLIMQTESFFDLSQKSSRL